MPLDSLQPQPHSARSFSAVDASCASSCGLRRVLNASTLAAPTLAAPPPPPPHTTSASASASAPASASASASAPASASASASASAPALQPRRQLRWLPAPSRSSPPHECISRHA